MRFVESKSVNSGEVVKLCVQEAGSGKPVIFISGWPLSHEMWEYQFNELPKHNLRCIGYDRRGFGRSDKPWNGYDYHTLAGDLNAVIEELDLTDVTLVGFSMGGGEVVRYLSNYGSGRVSKAVLIGSVVPFLLKTDDNPDGIPKDVFDGFVSEASKDRPKFLAGFAKEFYGNSFLNNTVSDEILQWHQGLALQASGHATIECIRSFSETDFRNDLAAVDVPLLIIHGDADKIVPIKISSDKTAEAIPDAEYVVFEGEPHGLFFTSKDAINEKLLAFINQD